MVVYMKRIKAGINHFTTITMQIVLKPMRELRLIYFQRVENQNCVTIHGKSLSLCVIKESSFLFLSSYEGGS